MYILKKIIGASSQVPEFIRCKTASDQSYKKNIPLIINRTTGVIRNTDFQEIPTHICAEDLAAGKSESVLCYPITGGMIFSAKAAADLSAVTPGTKCFVDYDENEHFCLITPDCEGASVIMVNNCGAKAAGDEVLIKIIQ